MLDTYFRKLQDCFEKHNRVMDALRHQSHGTKKIDLYVIKTKRRNNDV